jgi:hypothetical protein
MSTEFEEIFDSSSVRASLGLPPQPFAKDVTLPMDKPSWLIEAATTAPSKLVSTIESDAFVESVAGPSISPELAFDAGSVELHAFRKLKLVAVPPALEVGNEMSELFKSLLVKAKAKAAWSSEKRETAIREIVNKMRDSPAFKRVQNDDNWDKLVTHCCDHVCNSVLEACGEAS